MGVSLDDADHARIASLDATVRARDGSRYGGLYLADDGSVVLQTTGEARLDRWKVANTVGKRAVLVRHVDRPLSELLDVNERITAAYPALRAAGIQLSSFGVNTADNIVHIQIAKTSVAGAEAALMARFGGAVDVVRVVGDNVGAADRTSPYPHLRPGLRIVKKNGGSCTAGLQGRTADGRYFIMTAGHCDHDHTEGGWWQGKVNGPRIGMSTNNHWRNGTGCDCMAVGPIPVATVTQVVYLTSTSSQAVDTAVTPYQNERACYSGASTPTNAVHCGIAWEYPQQYVQRNYGDALITNVWLALRAEPTFGDSGGPVFDGYRALGIFSGSSGSNDQWWFVGIKVAQHYLGLTLVNYTPVP